MIQSNVKLQAGCNCKKWFSFRTNGISSGFTGLAYMLQPGLSYALREGPCPQWGGAGLICVEFPGVLTDTEGGSPGKGWAGTELFLFCRGL